MQEKVPTKFPYDLTPNVTSATSVVANTTRTKLGSIYCSIIGHTCFIRNEKDVTKSVIDLNCVRAVSPISQYKENSDIVYRIKVYISVTDFIQVSSRIRADVIEVSEQITNFIEKAAKASAEERKRLQQ